MNIKSSIDLLEKDILFSGEMYKRLKKDIDKLQLMSIAYDSSESEANKMNVLIALIMDQIETMQGAIMTAGATASGIQTTLDNVIIEAKANDPNQRLF